MIDQPIYIYFHICTIGDWERIVKRSLDKLRSSGLFDHCTELRLAVLGNKLQRVQELLEGEKIQIVFNSPDMGLYERPCIHHLRGAAEEEDGYYFYFHTKGVRAKNDRYKRNIDDWVDMMFYFLVERYKECLELLKTYGCVGVNHTLVGGNLLREKVTGRTKENSHHFSGNFWWANSSFLRTLPKKIGLKYLDPELWIGSGKGLMYSMHQSNCVNHYFHRYPRNRYVNIKSPHIVKLGGVGIPRGARNFKPRSQTTKVVQTRTIKHSVDRAKTVKSCSPHVSKPVVSVPRAKTQTFSLRRPPKRGSRPWLQRQKSSGEPAVASAEDPETVAETPVMIDDPIPEKPNYIYFHICTIGDWKRVVTKIFKRIQDHLLEVIKEIFVVVLGEELEAAKTILNHPKVTVVFHSTDTSIYERKCLSLLREHSEKEDFRVLYLHSKGVTKKKVKTVHDWVEFLLYFNIERYEDCLRLLKDHDTCGVNLNRPLGWVLQHSATEQNTNKALHYSGNFWWANSTYIRRLPKEIGPKYLDPELWIGSIQGKKMISLWQSNVDHYYEEYPRYIYKGKTNYKSIRK